MHPTAPSFRTLPLYQLGAKGVQPGMVGVGHDYSTQTPMDSSGRYVEDPRAFTFKAPLLLHVDSEQRDASAYPNAASFRMTFPYALRNVISIEVLSVAYANVSPTPPGRYVLLLNGLHDGTRFTPQTSHQMGIYQSALNTDRTAGATNNTLANYALAKLHYDTQRTADQHWRKSELRQIKYFNPPEERMLSIEFTLATRDGDRLVFDGGVSDHSWTCTLEIVCKN